MAKLDQGVAYLLWLASFVGVCGLQRFYVGHYGMGILYLLTFGLCGIGQFVDLFLIPGMVSNRNAELFARYNNLQAPVVYQTVQANPLAELTDMHKLLHAAKENGGSLSIAQATLLTKLDSYETKQLLQDAMKEGLAEVYNDPETGAVRYRFDV